jgi:type IV secretion system protein VirB9
MRKILIPILLISFIIIGFIKPSKAAGTDDSNLPVTTDSRIKTIVFNENEVIQLKFYYGFQSFIEFADDEEIQLISLGESFPWRITPAGKRLFIRPLQINITTNMIVITTKRTYQFEISSAEYDGRADEDLVYSVRFFYPSKDQLSGKVNKMPVTGEGVGTADIPEGSTLELGKISNSVGPVLNFDYSYVGADNSIVPLRVFDDGNSTYMQFPDNNLIVPTISAVDIYGNETPLNYYIDGDYVVVDNVEVQFSLRLSDKLVCIFNNAAM